MYRSVFFVLGGNCFPFLRMGRLKSCSNGWFYIASKLSSLCRPAGTLSFSCKFSLIERVHGVSDVNERANELAVSLFRQRRQPL